MPAVRVSKNQKIVRGLGLLASASIMSLMMAGEAQAACTTNPVQPLGTITTNNTTVVCTGANTGQTITANANNVSVNVSGTDTLDNSTVTLNGSGGSVAITNGATASGISLSLNGDNSTLVIGSGSIVSSTVGSITISGTSSGPAGQVTINGTLNGISGSGGYLITGGVGSQIFTLGAGSTLNVQADGLAINGGSGNDTFNFSDSANITGGTNNNIVFDGGSGTDDRANIYGSGITYFNTANVETVTVDPGVGGYRQLRGSNVDATQVNIVSGDVEALHPDALGAAQSTVNIDAAARLFVRYTAPGNFNHVLSGGGFIQLNGLGNTITVGGADGGFTGTVVIVAGTTAHIVNDGAFGSGTIDNNGTVSLGGVILANNISGAGQVIKTGTGTARLTGTNTFNGGLDIQGGSLEVTSVNSLGADTITSTTGGGILVIGNATNQTLSNELIGNVILVKQDAGILTLTGAANTYSGGTLINGGAVRVDSFARLGTGQVIANSGGSLILNYNGAGQLLQTSPFMTGAGSFIKEGTGDVVMNQTSTYTGGTIIRAGRIGLNNGDALGTGTIQVDSGAELGLGGIILNNAITGAGLIRKTSSNTAELYGNNSGFSGTMVVDDGFIYATDGRALGAGTLQINSGSGGVQLDANANTVVAAGLTGGGVFEKLGTGTAVLTGNGSTFTGVVQITDGTVQIEGSQNIGTANVSLDALGTLLLDTAGSTQLTNNISGAGRVIKTGTGTTFLTGTNTYTGGTDIQQGAIRVTNVSFLGTGAITVQAGAALDLSIAGSQTLNQNVTGAGILRKSNTGDLTLLNNGLTGGVDIVGGRVIVSTAGALGGGPVTTAADTQLVFNNNTTQTMSNLISGAGALTKDGTGTLVIQNANAYTGGTVINAGRLGLNDGQGLGTGSVIILSGAELGIGNVNFANNVSGAGRIVKTASGTANLTGTNTHTGGLDIQGGNVNVSGSAALGTGAVSIASGASLTYANASAATFSNGLSGAGAFNKLGTGQLTFANNFSIGSLNLNAGRTRINSIATGNVTVAANATLDGTGRIIGNLTNNGTVAPGNSIGTMTVQGNYVHNANSVLEIEFDGAGGIDLLAVTGTATLNGGTLRFVSLGGAEGQGGTFLTATGGITGTFANVQTVGALLPLAVVYEPNRAFMAPSVLTARPSTFNAQSMAAADTALGFVDSIGVGDVRHGAGNRLWLSGFGAWGKRSASGTTLAYDHDTRGMSGGVNFDVGGSVTLGAAIGWAKGDITLGANGGGGDQSSILGSLTARYSGTGVTFGGGLLYGKVDQETLRNVSFNGFSGSVDGETDSKIFGGFAELRLPLSSTAGWSFSANARGGYIKQKQDGYTESGTSPLRLTLGDLKTSTLEGQARLTAKTRLWGEGDHSDNGAGGLDLRVDLGGRYLGTLGDREIPVTFAVSNAGIVLQGDTRNTLQGLAGLSLDYTTRGGATISFGYRGEIGKTDRHAVQAGVSFAF